MSYTIIGESVKSAVSIKLGSIFTNCIRYKEAITNPVYPHFFINQISLTTTESGLKGRMKLDYLINIRYRHVADPTTINNIEQQLDAIGIKLCNELTSIEFQANKPIKTYNRNYEKADGILQFFCNVTVYAQPETTPGTKVNKLKLNEEVM